MGFLQSEFKDSKINPMLKTKIKQHKAPPDIPDLPPTTTELPFYLPLCGLIS
jgi:hypothetical protein